MSTRAAGVVAGCVVLASLALVGCGGTPDGGAGADGGVSPTADTGPDNGADPDADTATDNKNGPDTDAMTDLDAGPDTDTGPDPLADTGTDTGPDLDAPGDLDSGTTTDAGGRIDAARALDAHTGVDAAVARDVATPHDAGCVGSASGSSAIWTCTSDRAARQRCVAGTVETQRCATGACVPQPVGVPDVCPVPAPASNAGTYCPHGNCVHWWDCRITYQYQYPSNRDWDTDYHMPDGTPIILPHASRLTGVSIGVAGFMPDFTDTVTGQWLHFNHLHINAEFGGNNGALGPVQLVSMSDPAHPDHVYPAGWVVGFSGGGTRRTGYRGTTGSGNVCAGGVSTAAHFCAVTHPAHPINVYVPPDHTGCGTGGWPAGLWAMIHPAAPGYGSCPSDCTGCGASHF